MANRQHLEVFAGTDATLTINGRDASNAAVSLSGKTIAWYVARPPLHPDNTSAIFSKVGTATITASGVFTVTVDAADTTALEGDYAHQAKTTDGSSDVAVVCSGRFRVKPALVA